MNQEVESSLAVAHQEDQDMREDQNGDNQLDHIHIGIVQRVNEFDWDPVMESFIILGGDGINWVPKQNADGIRLRTKHFAQLGIV